MSRDMSLESHDTSLEYDDLHEPSAEELTLVSTRERMSGGEAEEERGGEIEGKGPLAQTKEKSEPPEQSREESEQTTGESEPPEQPPAQIRELTKEEDKFLLRSRAESEPPVQCGKHLQVVWSKSRKLLEKASSTPDLGGQCKKERQFTNGLNKELLTDEKRAMTSSLEVVVREDHMTDHMTDHTGQSKINVERTSSNEEDGQPWEECKVEDNSKQPLKDSDTIVAMTAAVEVEREGGSGQEKVGLPTPVLLQSPQNRLVEACHFISVSNEEVGHAWEGLLYNYIVTGCVDN